MSDIGPCILCSRVLDSLTFIPCHEVGYPGYLYSTPASSIVISAFLGYPWLVVDPLLVRYLPVRCMNHGLCRDGLASWLLNYLPFVEGLVYG